VSDALEARIRAAATRLGYVPNLSAKTLATRRSGLVGVLTGDLTEPLAVEILIACEGALAESGYGVTVAFNRRNDDPSAIRALLGRGAQAMIVHDTDVEPELGRGVQGIPWIRLESGAPKERGDRVSVGRREGMVLAARYLQSLGHDRISVIGPSEAMIEAVREALGSGSVMNECISGSLDLQPAREALRRWLSSAKRPTAIVCPNDLIALAALRECACRGVPVPRAVSLIGFGDTAFGRHAHPALSTVRVAAAEIGRRLAETVLAAIEGRDTAATETPVKLIIRESTAAPGSDAAVGLSMFHVEPDRRST
jgi:LacI family transcriptional regulator